MSATSKIEWTEKTWNPVRGCSIVSPGCVNCYAMKQAHRFSGEGRAYFGLTKQTKAGPQWTGKIATVEDALLEPLSWRKPARVFVNSMSDLFHEDVPFEFVDRVFAVMAMAQRHTFQVLTKRADLMRSHLYIFHDFPIDRRNQAQAGVSLIKLPPTHWHGHNGFMRNGETYIVGHSDGTATIEISRKASVTRDRAPDMELQAPIDELIAFAEAVLSQLLHEKERLSSLRLQKNA